MVLEDELEELALVKKDLRALRSVAGMAAAYPAWGGEADAVRVIASALRSVEDRLSDVLGELYKACLDEGG